jgi:hypothetical protein
MSVFILSIYHNFQDNHCTMEAMLDFLDFRDSIFPYIGLIVGLVVLVAAVIPAFVMHHRRVFF